jgi:hypothetical protein
MVAMRVRKFVRINTPFAVGSLLLVSLAAAHTQKRPTYKPTGGEGAIKGTISFVGTPQEPRRLDTSADPICEQVNPGQTDEWYVVTNQKLANVVVYIRGESLNGYSFTAPSNEVTLEHKGCRYVPHVLGVQTQQTVRVLNNDPTTQNTHATPKNNPDWNQSQPAAAAALELRFASPEMFVPMKDNQHPWEHAYIGVFPHPFFSVSNTDGSYEISGIPPGQYVVVAWHEKLGEQTADVFVGLTELKKVDFSFKASDH